ncbi:MAG TPA: branched-chain amino acid ABC transporter permease [Syntrophorhabdales bacterium]|nr:branched-chain amino acid ABC transporter permease [Syntrophorhabdales bacterium]
MASSFLQKLFGIVIVALALASFPFWASRYWVLIVLLFSLNLALSQMWNLLAGYSGLISLGQQAFVGLGGYTLAVFSMYYGFPIWLSVLIGGAVSVLFALLISAPIFRMRGVYFAIGTWTVAETLRILFSNWKYVGYGMGLFVKPAYTLSFNTIFYAGLGMGVASVLVVYFILRSKLGLGLMAMRDDETSSETMGVDIFRTKLACFVLAAGVTGVTSGVLYLHNIFIQPFSAFGIDWTVRLVFITIIGGIGTIEGPIVGSLIYVILQQWLSEYPSVSLLILGVIAIAVILVAPKGIMGTIQERLGFEILSPRRK